MASLYTRAGSPFHWIKYRGRDGKIVQESTGCRVGDSVQTRRAQTIRAQREIEELQFGETRLAAAGWAWVPDFLKTRYHSSPVTCERYLDAWATLRLFIDERKIRTPTELLRQHCFDYIAWRKSPDKSKGKYKACHNTALLELKALRIILQEAVERGLIIGNPCAKLGIKKERAKEKPELTEEDCERIRKGIPLVENPAERQMLSVSFEIARYQGCRLSETRINPMTDVQIRGATGRIVFRAKGGREFSTMLHPKLFGLFERLRAENKSETWSVPAGRGRQWASGVWFRFLDGLGLKERGVTFHCTRVTVVTELARGDVPESKAKSYVGHSSTTVHRIYQRLRPDDLSGCADAIGK